MPKFEKTTSLTTYVLIYAVLLVVTAFAVYPILQVIGVSLRPHDMLHTTSLRLIPPEASLASYRTLIAIDQAVRDQVAAGWERGGVLGAYRALTREKPFVGWLLNSTLVSFLVTILSVALASTAGYAFSRYKFIGRDASLIALITTQMFPVTMLLLPLFLMLIKLKVYNTYWGLIIAYSATALPFCIWQMKGYYDTVPHSLEEAARIDGCSPFRTFYQIVLPLVLPALVITALFSFMAAWSEYLVAAVIINDKALYTLPIGLKQFQSNFETQWGLYAAGAVLVCLPVVTLFLFLSRWLISGLTLGSVKG
ncbi:MAG: ABC transporter permease subunit [candidate division KSB1 bacterium]|nr:ABC transporter permease subunit [candidate division KSB1 bacterium]MDZ7275945.1 ABC transporter permease subunit [candidate division KSB1 bacterium]MDZ7285773.1 ABC transporter permease subunit [candidate division KSB1 bacterium]MDZ7298805.1 ABC transporter permease subunit [candidate division KSB1 bacterium]MDZ7308849.1 ABC transporter permease subunit [candidate division KSB1 bacterium]